MEEKLVLVAYPSPEGFSQPVRTQRQSLPARIERGFVEVEYDDDGNLVGVEAKKAKKATPRKPEEGEDKEND